MRPGQVVVHVAAGGAGAAAGPFAQRPASWQMYSAEPPVGYTGTDAAGRTRQLRVDRLPPVLRAVDTGRFLPERLCDRDDDLVMVERTGGTRPGTFAC